MEEAGYAPSLQWDAGVCKYLSDAYGANHFDEICKALTCPSVYSCVRVNTMQATTEGVIEALSDHLSHQKGNLAEVGKCYEHPILKNVVIVEGDGPCQVNYTEQKIVMVSRKCAEAVLRGSHIYVPGVMACSEHVDVGDTVAVFARIERLDGSGKWSKCITRGTTLPLHGVEEYLGDDWRNWFIGKGRAMLSRTTLFRETQGLAVEMIERIYNLPSFHGLLEGKIFLQNLPSIVTAHVLDPKPGERILDMCAAPGGKTTAIAALMNDQGEIIALDRSHNKVFDIMSLAKELGFSCIKAFKLDALKSVQENLDFKDSHSHMESCLLKETKEEEDDEKKKNKKKENESGQYMSRAKERKEARRMKSGNVGEGIKGFPPHYFDRILLDAPCSALGLRPRLFAAQETLESLRGSARYQMRMFDQAVQLVRPGGTIVYSTCTINPGECEAVVRYAVDKYKFLSLVPQEPYLGGFGLVGGDDVYDGKSFREWLKEEEKHLVQRFDPSNYASDTIGFFIAKFRVS